MRACGRSCKPNDGLLNLYTAIKNFAIGSPEAREAWGQGYLAAKAQGADAENEFLRNNPPPSFGSTKLVATVAAGGVGPSPTGTINLYRAVGIGEMKSIQATGKFLPGGGSMEGRQFALTFDEALTYAKSDLSKVAIYEARIPRIILPAFDHARKGIDVHIFTDVYTIQRGFQQELFNGSLKSVKQVF